MNRNNICIVVTELISTEAVNKVSQKALGAPKSNILNIKILILSISVGHLPIYPSTPKNVVLNPDHGKMVAVPCTVCEGLLFCTILVGALLLVIADLAARWSMVFAPTELPIGITQPSSEHPILPICYTVGDDKNDWASCPKLLVYQKGLRCMSW